MIFYNLSSFYLCMLALCMLVNSKGRDNSAKEVVVVGGGLAGMVAARRLLKEPNIKVRVLEAHRSRYGGRIWTNRNGLKGIRGVDVELGAMFLNTLPENRRLLQLAEEFELSMSSIDNLQLHFIDVKGNNVVSGENATRLYREAVQVVINRLEKVKKEGVDRPIRDVYLEAVDEVYNAEDHLNAEEKVHVARIIMSFPVTMLSNFSSLLYNIQSEFGWSQVIIDGMDAFLDRIVAGSGLEAPVKIDLKKVVRNIQVDNKRKKVLIRTSDRKQITADAVVVALPVGVLKKKTVIFDPPLPTDWYKALNDIGLGYSMKVVVGFDKAFWPKDVGVFSVFSELASNGFLQTWTNAYKFSRNPFLIGDIFGSEALVWETRPESELKTITREVLSELFGAEIVNAHNMTTFFHSNWSNDDFTQGSVAYPRVGNSHNLWSTLKQPFCPYIYFAGAYQETVSGMESLHGAYDSGIHAAEHIIEGVCKQSAKSKPQAKSGKKSSKSGKRKDEL